MLKGHLSVDLHCAMSFFGIIRHPHAHTCCYASVIIAGGDAGVDPGTISNERLAELEAVLVDENATDAELDAAAEMLAAIPADDDNADNGGKAVTSQTDGCRSNACLKKFGDACANAFQRM